jgi:hypothetical protein
VTFDAAGGEIVAGTYDYYFDFSADGAISNAELSEWLVDSATANGFIAPCLFGDANLDGRRIRLECPGPKLAG